jgi:30S ribosomal protein S31
VGKGDPRTRRGKIFKGTYGKKRPKGGRRGKKAQAQAAAAAS